jgi:predicted Zn-dependent peptidase
VFESDSVTNIAHQIGYFHPVASVDAYQGMGDRIAAVTLDDVARVADRYLRTSNCTVGIFEPQTEAAQ